MRRKHHPSGIFHSGWLDGFFKMDPRIGPAILDVLKPKSLVDLGAGAGLLVRWLRGAGVAAVGVDGIDGVEERTGGLVLQHDLRFQAAVPVMQCATCLEVGEHVPGENLPQFLNNVAMAATDIIAVSWSNDGVRGRGHVSPRRVEWVVAEMQSRGWPADWVMTRQLRRRAGRGWQRVVVYSRR